MEAIFLKSTEDGPQPDVKFISPNADLDASMRLITTLMNLFATSEGQSPKLVSTTGDAEKYSSGVDRFLAQIEAFEASKEDLEQFRAVESEIFEIVMAWANLYSGTTNSPLKAKTPSFSDETYLQVKFAEPQFTMNAKEREEAEYLKVEKGISSLVMAVMNIFGLDEESAIAHLEKVRQQQALVANKEQADPAAAAKTETPDSQTESEEEAEMLDLVNGPVNNVVGDKLETTQKVADTALNGAQVTAMIEVVTQVALGQIPRESAVQIMQQAFLISEEEANKLLGPAGKGFKPAQGEPQNSAAS